MPIGTSATELDYMLADLQGPGNVVFGAQTTSGICTNTETPVVDPSTGATLMVRRTELLIRDGTLTGLDIEATITVDGTAYVIRNLGSVQPNGMKPLELAPVTS